MELDAKIMVDAFHSEPLAIDKFECIIDDYRSLVANSYFSIQFIKRYANRQTHCLPKAVHFNTSFFISFFIFFILKDILLVDLIIS